MAPGARRTKPASSLLVIYADFDISGRLLALWLWRMPRVRVLRVVEVIPEARRDGGGHHSHSRAMLCRRAKGRCSRGSAATGYMAVRSQEASPLPDWASDQYLEVPTTIPRA